MGPENMVKTTVFLADMADFPKMNEVYARFLGKEPPARSTMEAGGLPQGAKVEIDLIAAFFIRTRATRPQGSSRMIRSSLLGGGGLASCRRRLGPCPSAGSGCRPQPPLDAGHHRAHPLRFGLNRRWVTLWAWLIRFPDSGPLPQTSHR